MATNFPGSVDNASTVGDGTHPSADELLSSTDGGPAHHALHQNVGLAINAIEDKLGVGASTPVVGSVLTGTGSGESEWSTNPLSVDATNSRVGIGTTSPTRILDIEDATAAIIGLNDSGGTVGSNTNSRIIFEAGGATAGQIGFQNTTSGILGITNNDGPLYLNTASADDILLRPNSSTAMTVKSDGKVGIGTTSPANMLSVGSGSNYGSFNVHAWKGVNSFAVLDNVVKSDNIRQLTTTVSANTYTDGNTGVMYRSTTSSARYKTDIETMNDEYADAILGLRPVWYRSICPGDHESFGYWGFIAEEVAEVDPRLVTFTVPDDYEWQYDDEGQKIAPGPDDLTVPEGMQYERVVPHLVNLLARQRDQIADLSARVATLEAA